MGGKKLTNEQEFKLYLTKPNTRNWIPINLFHTSQNAKFCQYILKMSGLYLYISIYIDIDIYICIYNVSLYVYHQGVVAHWKLTRHGGHIL